LLYPESIHSSNEAKRMAGVAIVTAQKAADRDGVAVKGGSGADTDVIEQSGEDAEYVYYTVKYFKKRSKDCLWFIARKYYKNPRLWKKIYNANRDLIKNPHLIKPGWKLRVPKLK
jgi:nucleoid-associated protein YgaU